MLATPKHQKVIAIELEAYERRKQQTLRFLGELTNKQRTLVVILITVRWFNNSDLVKLNGRQKNQGKQHKPP